MNRLRRFRKLLIAIIVTFSLSLVVSPSTMFGEGFDEPNGLDNLHLWIYPEYDNPALLVMLQGQIVGVQPPATVRFMVPSAAEMYSAGSIDSQGRYTGGPPERQPSDIAGWDVISYSVDSGMFRVEYYVPIISSGNERTIEYEFRRFYPASSLHVLIQEPLKSSDFEMPPEGGIVSEDEGFLVHVFEYSDLDVEMPIKFDISYTRSTDIPSLSLIDNNSSAGVLIAVGIIAAVLVIAVLWMRRSKPKTGKRRQPGPNNSNRKARRHNIQRYCEQCGRTAGKSAAFCQHCGAELAAESKR